MTFTFFFLFGSIALLLVRNQLLLNTHTSHLLYQMYYTIKHPGYLCAYIQETDMTAISITVQGPQKHHQPCAAN